MNSLLSVHLLDYFLKMSDRFSIIPFKQLVQIILNQLDTNSSFFGIPNELFFNPNKGAIFQTTLYGQKLESPIGVAAGPHTQLAQNIVAAWLCGARFIELKTVQTLDELDVSKPCIDMQDEGYNCEWSQELKIKESFNQYLEAWILIHLLKDKLKLGENDDLGVIFNMSVGYDYKGILNENVQWFFSKMANASTEINQKIAEIEEIYPNIVNLNIPSQLSNNITLSTMHGCPPEEIEQIGAYLISEKKLHTSIKLNPTLLGEKELRKIMADSGFETSVPDIAFEHDLKYNDAINIITRLQKKADENKVFFGLKLTNTLESLNHKEVFPSEEKMMYASGKVLHPISINLAKKLQNEFSGKLNISFSGGADAFNTPNIVASGLFPVTVCSDILKPGGYGKLHQYIEQLRLGKKRDTLEKTEASNKSFLKHLNTYATEVLSDTKYKKTGIQDKSIKTDRKLHYFDCVHAPCVDSCATSQGIPDYLYHTANGDFDKAFEVILQTNPFPNTTGMVCDHLCQSKCTRINYDSPVLIRDIKSFIAKNGKYNELTASTKAVANIKSVAVIGAGPAGLSAASFLKKSGFEVNVYEEKQRSGGMVMGAIPSFRLKDESIDKDIQRIEKLGVSIHYGEKITASLFSKIKKSHDYVFIAMGAQKAKEANLEGDTNHGVLNPLEFLFQVKKNNPSSIGKNVLIIGGGNTAMDAARTALRLVGKSGSVKVIYRRTKKEMPADFDEIIAVQEEGIEIVELTSPVRINAVNGNVNSLSCVKMQLGKKDTSGRARPIPIPDSEFEIKADTIIPAFGQDRVIDFIEPNLLETNPNSYEIQLPNIFIGGDALRGGSTVINAVGDGRKVAEEIIKKSNGKLKGADNKYNKGFSNRELIVKKAKTMYSEVAPHKADSSTTSFNLSAVSLSKEQAIKEASRCLYCDEVCNICTSVCPNLALFPFETPTGNYLIQKLISDGKDSKIVDNGFFKIEQKPQILLLSDWCNECGNCDTFCPTSGAPYKDKPHVYLNYEAFLLDKETCFYYSPEGDEIVHKSAGQIARLKKENNSFIYKSEAVEILFEADAMEIKDYKVKEKDTIEFDTRIALEMRLLLNGAKQIL